MVKSTTYPVLVVLQIVEFRLMVGASLTVSVTVAVSLVHVPFPGIIYLYFRLFPFRLARLSDPVVEFNPPILLTSTQVAPVGWSGPPGMRENKSRVPCQCFF